MFVIFGVVGVAVVVAVVVANSGPPILLALLWDLVVVWNGYWFLFRGVAYDSTSRSRASLGERLCRSGTIALTDLVEMRPSRFGSSVQVLRLADGSKVLVIDPEGLRRLHG